MPNEFSPPASLRAAVERFARPSATSFALLEQAAERRALVKGEYLLREGDAARHVAFVESGLLRYFYLSKDGSEHTGQFFFPGAFVSDVASLVLKRPAQQNIDALEPTVVRLIPYPTLLELYDTDPAFERFGRRLFQEVMAFSQLRTASFLLQSAEERYLSLLEHRPKVIESVPLYQVASYLGVTPEALSRIRARISRSDRS